MAVGGAFFLVCFCFAGMSSNSSFYYSLTVGIERNGRIMSYKRFRLIADPFSCSLLQFIDLNKGCNHVLVLFRIITYYINKMFIFLLLSSRLSLKTREKDK